MSIWATLIHLAFVLLLATSPGLAQPVTLRVRPEAPPDGDGLSWNTAYQHLQQALDQAALLVATGQSVDIWLGRGSYVPTARTIPELPESATFQLLNNVIVYGGFAGFEAALEERDYQANATILDGDFRIDTIVTMTDLDHTAVLDGVTIRNSAASATVIIDGTPTIRHCRFVDNTIDRFPFGGGSGAAVATSITARPRLEHCDFVNNSTTSSGSGGAFYGNGFLFRCRFERNSAVNTGGAIRGTGSTLAVINCDFVRNIADAGGAIYLEQNADVFGCTFTHNTATIGGAIRIRENSNGDMIFRDCEFASNQAFEADAIDIDPSVHLNVAHCSFSGHTHFHFVPPSLYVNCAFTGNDAPFSGDFHGCLIANNRASCFAGQLWNCTVADNTSSGSLPYLRASDVVNSILHGNRTGAGGSGEIAQVSTDSINYSYVEGWTGLFGGEGNLGEGTPLFAEPGSYRLLATSGCIDRGSYARVPLDVLDVDLDGNITERLPLDQDGSIRYVDDPLSKDVDNVPVDLGAYEMAPTYCVWTGPPNGAFADQDNWFNGPPGESSWVVLSTTSMISLPFDAVAGRITVVAGNVVLTGGRLSTVVPRVDAVDIRSGASLVLDRTVLSATGVHVQNLAALASNESSTIEADILCEGDLRPGGVGGVGSFHILGDLAFRRPFGGLPGRLDVDVVGGEDGEADSIIVDGTVMLAGSASVRAPVSGLLDPGDSIVLIDASGNIVDDFDTIIVAPARGDGYRYALRDVLRGGGAFIMLVEPLIGGYDPSEPLRTAVDGVPSAAAVGDLNGDGLDDLAVGLSAPSAAEPGALAIFLNNGVDGHFGSEVYLSLPSGADPSDVYLFDLDGGDGLDIALVDRALNRLAIFLNRSGGKFALPPDQVITEHIERPEALCIAPLAASGLPYISVANGGLAPDNAYAAFFQPPFPFTNVPRSDVPLPEGPVDANPFESEDLKPTRFVGFSSRGGDSLLIVRVVPEDEEPRTSLVEVGSRPSHFVLAPLNNDVHPDIVVLRPSEGVATVAIGLGFAGGFPSFGPPISIDVGPEPLSVAAGDIDGDGDSDLVFVVRLAQSEPPVIRIMRQDRVDGSAAVHLAPIDLTNELGAELLQVLVGNLNGDEDVDIVATQRESPRGGGPAVISRVNEFCEADWDRSGAINSADFFRFLLSFFDGAADVNRDGTTSSQDLFDYLLLFFSECV